MNWLCKWYSEQCDGNWEHTHGITIETLDNPGWSVTVDTNFSSKVLKEIKWIYFEKSDEDWYGYKVENGIFESSGDPHKLEFLIEVFKNLVESI
jgi:Immunity protein 53